MPESIFDRGGWDGDRSRRSPLDHGAVKTISVGAKLRADFGSFDRSGLFEPAPYWRAYLRRA